ncbi:MAG TPA: hypothetical protein VIL83_07655 [Capillibacterium sp.]
MPKQVILDLLNNKHFLLFFLIACVYLFNWTVILKLGLIIQRFSIKTKKVIFPWALIGVLYSFFGKLIIADYVYILGALILLSVLLWGITKVQFSKVIFSALMSLLIAIFSFLLFGQILLINDNFRTIMFDPLGILVGSLLESILPFLFVFIYSQKTIIEKDKFSFPYSFFNIFLLLILYSMFAIVFQWLAYYQYLIIWQVILIEFILICLTFVVLIYIRYINRLQRQKNEENHSSYLLGTILSKQREYRNFFQVIRAMAEKDKNQKIVDYIDNILADMSLVEECNGVNPIFAACQVAEQIKAKEKGVKVSTITKSTLSNLKEPIKVYDIFKDLLQFFIAYEEQVFDDEHLINVEIDETDQEYIFKIIRKNGREEARAELKTLSAPPEGEGTLKQIAKRIGKLRGKVYFLYEEDDLRGCLFKVAKTRPINFLFPV